MPPSFPWDCYSGFCATHPSYHRKWWLQPLFFYAVIILKKMLIAASVLLCGNHFQNGYCKEEQKLQSPFSKVVHRIQKLMFVLLEGHVLRQWRNEYHQFASLFGTDPNRTRMTPNFCWSSNQMLGKILTGKFKMRRISFHHFTKSDWQSNKKKLILQFSSVRFGSVETYKLMIRPWFSWDVLYVSKYKIYVRLQVIFSCPILIQTVSIIAIWFHNFCGLFSPSKKIQNRIIPYWYINY